MQQYDKYDKSYIHSIIMNEFRSVPDFTNLISTVQS